MEKDELDNYVLIAMGDLHIAVARVGACCVISVLVSVAFNDGCRRDRKTRNRYSFHSAEVPGITRRE